MNRMTRDFGDGTKIQQFCDASLEVGLKMNMSKTKVHCVHELHIFMDIIGPVSFFPD